MRACAPWVSRLYVCVAKVVYRPPNACAERQHTCFSTTPWGKRADVSFIRNLEEQPVSNFPNVSMSIPFNATQINYGGYNNQVIKYQGNSPYINIPMSSYSSSYSSPQQYSGPQQYSSGKYGYNADGQTWGNNPYFGMPQGYPSTGSSYNSGGYGGDTTQLKLVLIQAIMALIGKLKGGYGH